MQGYKTYLAAAALAIFAIAGVITGKLDFSTAYGYVMQAAVAAGIRNAIANQ